MAHVDGLGNLFRGTPAAQRNVIGPIPKGGKMDHLELLTAPVHPSPSKQTSMPPKRSWSQSNDGQSPSRPRPTDSSLETHAPAISRKVKACAACRKQKVGRYLVASYPVRREVRMVSADQPTPNILDQVHNRRPWAALQAMYGAEFGMRAKQKPADAD